MIFIIILVQKTLVCITQPFFSEAERSFNIVANSRNMQCLISIRLELL